MTVTRTSLLDLPVITTGTESGKWGDFTNNGLTQYLDIAIAGTTSLTSANFTAGALTIETTEGTDTATNITATSAQYATFRVSSLATNSTITVGNTGASLGRSYRIINADATYTLTFKATGQTGVTFQPGQSGIVAFNGTDYVVVGTIGPLKTINCTSLLGPGNIAVGTGSVSCVATSNGPAPINGLTLTGGPITSTGTVTLGGGVNVSTINTGILPVANGGTGLCTVGTTGNVLTSNGTAWVSQAAGGGANLQTFSASGTYTKPPSANFVYVELWGAGGGGGRGASFPSAYATLASGKGGGGGAHVSMMYIAPQVGATVPVTIGAGGTGGGPTSAPPSRCQIAKGGDGGTTSFGTLLAAGGGVDSGPTTSTSGGFGGSVGTCLPAPGALPLADGTPASVSFFGSVNIPFGGSVYGGGRGASSKGSPGSGCTGKISLYGGGGGGSGGSNPGPSPAPVANGGDGGRGRTLGRPSGPLACWSGGGAGGPALGPTPTRNGADGAAAGGGGGGGAGFVSCSGYGGSGGNGGNGYAIIYTW